MHPGARDILKTMAQHFQIPIWFGAHQVKCGVMIRLLSLLNSNHTIWALTLQTRQCFCGTVSLLCASILHTHTHTHTDCQNIACHNLLTDARTHIHTHAHTPSWLSCTPAAAAGRSSVTAGWEQVRVETRRPSPSSAVSFSSWPSDWLTDWQITAQTEPTNSLQRSQHCCFFHQHGVRLKLCFLPLFVAKGSYQVCRAPECGCTVSNSEMRAGQQRTPARDIVAFCAPVCSVLPAVPAVRYSTWWQHWITFDLKWDVCLKRVVVVECERVWVCVVASLFIRALVHCPISVQSLWVQICVCILLLVCCSACFSLSVCGFVCVCVFVYICVCVCGTACLTLPFPSWPHSRAQQHVNGGRKRQSCHRGAGGAPGLRSCHSLAPHTHPESEPHPVPAPDTHHPVAGSSHARSHEESQSHSLQHTLAHTVAEVRLPPHTQPLSHGQGREGSSGPCREAHQAHWTALPQNTSAGKLTCLCCFSSSCHQM